MQVRMSKGSRGKVWYSLFSSESRSRITYAYKRRPKKLLGGMNSLDTTALQNHNLLVRFQTIYDFTVTTSLPLSVIPFHHGNRNDVRITHFPSPKKGTHALGCQYAAIAATIAFYPHETSGQVASVNGVSTRSIGRQTLCHRRGL